MWDGKLSFILNFKILTHLQGEIIFVVRILVGLYDLSYFEKEGFNLEFYVSAYLLIIKFKHLL